MTAALRPRQSHTEPFGERITGPLFLTGLCRRSGYGYAIGSVRGHRGVDELR
ncbi:hypothetical protein IF2G_09033 [Cordyceps javanica]|nr:hypothetical protein IF2G_09033 [Cordyceps javanica]